MQNCSKLQENESGSNKFKKQQQQNNTVFSICSSLPVVVEDFKAIDLQDTNNSVLPMDGGVWVLDLNNIIDAGNNPTEKALVYGLWWKWPRKFSHIGNEFSVWISKKILFIHLFWLFWLFVAVWALL